MWMKCVYLIQIYYWMSYNGDLNKAWLKHRMNKEIKKVISIVVRQKSELGVGYEREREREREGCRGGGWEEKNCKWACTYLRTVVNFNKNWCSVYLWIHYHITHIDNYLPFHFDLMKLFPKQCFLSVISKQAFVHVVLPITKFVDPHRRACYSHTAFVLTNRRISVE